MRHVILLLLVTLNVNAEGWETAPFIGGGYEDNSIGSVEFGFSVYKCANHIEGKIFNHRSNVHTTDHPDKDSNTFGIGARHYLMNGCELMDSPTWTFSPLVTLNFDYEHNPAQKINSQTIRTVGYGFVVTKKKNHFEFKAFKRKAIDGPDLFDFEVDSVGITYKHFMSFLE